ncbi:MAG: hypothetical protein OET44_12890 [Gammaproteobacteria bacterium]|nr:hypothetical protein [Gammaproteobacteria bacterium]
MRRCDTRAKQRQLFELLREQALAEGMRKTLYRNTRPENGSALEKLAWAEDIVNLFGDRAWAARAYADLAAEVAESHFRDRLSASRKLFVDERL